MKTITGTFVSKDRKDQIIIEILKLPNNSEYYRVYWKINQEDSSGKFKILFIPDRQHALIDPKLFDSDHLLIDYEKDIIKIGEIDFIRKDIKPPPFK